MCRQSLSRNWSKLNEQLTVTITEVVNCRVKRDDLWLDGVGFGMGSEFES